MLDEELYEPDIYNFFVRAGIANSTQKIAVSNLVYSLKAEGLWDKADMIYPLVGGTSQSTAKNLRGDYGHLTWGVGVTFAATGVTGHNSYGDNSGMGILDYAWGNATNKFQMTSGSYAWAIRAAPRRTRPAP